MHWYYFKFCVASCVFRIPFWGDVLKTRITITTLHKKDSQINCPVHARRAWSKHNVSSRMIVTELNRNIFPALQTFSMLTNADSRIHFKQSELTNLTYPIRWWILVHKSWECLSYELISVNIWPIPLGLSMNPGHHSETGLYYADITCGYQI
jgi:hypothetical protein